MADPVADELVASLARPGRNVTGTTFPGPEVATEHAEALIVLPSPMLFAQYRRIVTNAENGRLPGMGAAREFADLGGLMSYGANQIDLARQTATYVDKILKGAKPAELPVEQPIKFELVINLKTAKALGIEVPPSVIARADEVIE
jgi:putative ABC transport system substrate-binding protein